MARCVNLHEYVANFMVQCNIFLPCTSQEACGGAPRLVFIQQKCLVVDTPLECEAATIRACERILVVTAVVNTV
jgi:hypothetical protein